MKDKIVKGRGVYIAKGALVAGDVRLGDNVNIWFGASLRGDIDYIEIGDNSNVQDSCTLHSSKGFPTVLGKNVTVGHNAIVHGARICDNVMVGMGSVVLDGTVVGSDTIIGAGAVIPGGREIPGGSVVVGNPYKVLRNINEAEKKRIRDNAEEYVKLAAEYSESGF